MCKQDYYASCPDGCKFNNDIFKDEIPQGSFCTNDDCAQHYEDGVELLSVLLFAVLLLFVIVFVIICCSIVVCCCCLYYLLLCIL
jgi:hypothetical protein